MTAAFPQFTTVIHTPPQFTTLTVEPPHALHHSYLPPIGGSNVVKCGDCKKSLFSHSTDRRSAMIRTIKAIPTKYADTMFRSRLEARWAAFFDLVGIQWEYEPCEFHGWCPDFALMLDGATVYAEVKPVALVKRDAPNGLHLPSDASFEKAKRHWQNVWVLLLGASPQTDSEFFGFGKLLDPPKNRTGWLDVKKQLGALNERAIWRRAGNIVQWVPA